MIRSACRKIERENVRLVQICAADIFLVIGLALLELNSPCGGVADGTFHRLVFVFGDQLRDAIECEFDRLYKLLCQSK